jgi:hypothetical protein
MRQLGIVLLGLLATAAQAAGPTKPQLIQQLAASLRTLNLPGSAEAPPSLTSTDGCRVTYGTRMESDVMGTVTRSYTFSMRDVAGDDVHIDATRPERPILWISMQGDQKKVTVDYRSTRGGPTDQGMTERSQDRLVQMFVDPATAQKTVAAARELTRLCGGNMKPGAGMGAIGWQLHAMMSVGYRVAMDCQIAEVNGIKGKVRDGGDEHFFAQDMAAYNNAWDAYWTRVTGGHKPEFTQRVLCAFGEAKLIQAGAFVQSDGQVCQVIGDGAPKCRPPREWF